jgi:AraC-like DNA-binding protein
MVELNKKTRRSTKMNFSALNPFIRSVALYEVINKPEECRTYDCRIIYTVSGDIAVNIEDEKKFHLSAGMLLFIPAGTKYKLKGQYLRAVVINFDPTDAWAHINERIAPAAPDKFEAEKCHSDDFAPFDKVIIAKDMESERDTFIRMTNIATSAEGEWRAELSAMLKLILLKLAETVNDSALPARMVESLDTYIRENCSEEISNTEIGAIFGYHPFYVSRVLKEKKGITLHQYIISYRLKAAKKLLENTKKSIAEIAEETGFTDASYFTKTFRQAFGITPKDWRNKFKEDFI